jgi:hypothetical protein
MHFPSQINQFLCNRPDRPLKAFGRPSVFRSFNIEDVWTLGQASPISTWSWILVDIIRKVFASLLRHCASRIMAGKMKNHRLRNILLPTQTTFVSLPQSEPPPTNMVIFRIHVKSVRGSLDLFQILRRDKEYDWNKQMGNAITPVTNQKISGAQTKMRNGGFQQRKNQTQKRGYWIVQLVKYSRNGTESTQTLKKAIVKKNHR